VETVENGLGKHNPKLLTLSTLVTATQRMFPSLKSVSDLAILRTKIEQVVDLKLLFSHRRDIIFKVKCGANFENNSSN
jgi:hypothetical protein